MLSQGRQCEVGRLEKCREVGEKRAEKPLGDCFCVAAMYTGATPKDQEIAMAQDELSGCRELREKWHHNTRRVRIETCNERCIERCIDRDT